MVPNLCYHHHDCHPLNHHRVEYAIYMALQSFWRTARRIASSLIGKRSLWTGERFNGSFKSGLTQGNRTGDFNPGKVRGNCREGLMCLCE